MVPVECRALTNLMGDNVARLGCDVGKVVSFALLPLVLVDDHLRREA